MERIKQLIFKFGLSMSLVGCASSGQQFFDSAMNDHNRAPASIGVPDAFDQKDVVAIDPMHNQAEADFLFLKSEIESGAGHSSETLELLKSALVYDPNSATLMQKLAIEYYKNSKLSESLEWAQKAREKSPERRDLSLLVAGLFTNAKEYVKAADIYKHLIKKDHGDTESMLYLGAVYTEQKNYPQAIRTFKALTQFPDYSSKYLAHYYLARVYFEQGRSSSALVQAELKKSIALKPDFFDAVSMLGHLIEKEQGVAKAYKFYEQQQAKNGPNVKLAELLAQYYISKNNFDKAYEQLEILDESSEDLMQVKLKMALILIDKKFYDKAISKLQEILVLAPESDKVRFYLAAVNEEKKDFQTAIGHYLKIEPTSSYFEDARQHAAYLSKVGGDLDRAVMVLKDGIAKKAVTPNSYFLLSQLFEDKKEMNHALETLVSAEEKFPENSQVFYYLGTLQDKMNLKAQMVESMKKVIQIEPDHAQALNFLAYTWAEKGEQLDLAEDYARKASMKEKEDAFIMDTLGWVLFKRGDYKEAINVLEKAHDMQPQVSIIMEHLGDVYTKLNKNSKARSLFIKAVETEADVERKKEISGKISLVEDKIKSVRAPAAVGLDSDISESP
jgi:tetratricopeptide (TPR) repeat protein